MDHDDELFPDALADAYRFAVEHRADVVNTKECVTHGWSWGFSHYQRDVAPQQVTDPESLMPMRPHKFYRLDLLNTAGIRFREGRRVIYEDVFFNLEVLAHARRVAVLSSRPFYRWVNTGENNSSTYGKDPDEAWETFAEIFELIATLDLDPAARDFMVLHTYRLALHADHVSWSTDGSLEIAGEAVWHDADGAPWPVRRDGVRLIRVLPQALDGAVPDDLVDLTAETGRAEAAFTVKGKDDRFRLGRASVERRPVRDGRKKVWGAKPAPGGRGGRRPRPGAGQA